VRSAPRLVTHNRGSRHTGRFPGSVTRSFGDTHPSTTSHGCCSGRVRRVSHDHVEDHLSLTHRDVGVCSVLHHLGRWCVTTMTLRCKRALGKKGPLTGLHNICVCDFPGGVVAKHTGPNKGVHSEWSDRRSRGFRVSAGYSPEARHLLTHRINPEAIVRPVASAFQEQASHSVHLPSLSTHFLLLLIALQLSVC
jgi:hypothetical protein